MGRRVCPVCTRNYNVAHIDRSGYYMKALLPQKQPGHCDDCENVKLVIRDDDKESVIKERFEIYREKTEPILDYYRSERSRTTVVDLEPKRGVDDFHLIQEVIDDQLKQIHEHMTVRL